MVRDTSIEVYQQIRDEGLLSKVRFSVYSCVFKFGPITQGEVKKKLNMDSNTATPRFAELKTQGVITEVGKRPCKITGRTVYEWDVTNKLPKPLPKKKTKDQIIEELRSTIKKAQNYCMTKKGFNLLKEIRDK